jgi:hypothetical protein
MKKLLGQPLWDQNVKRDIAAEFINDRMLGHILIFELLRTVNVYPRREMPTVVCYSECRKKANGRYLQFSRVPWHVNSGL